MSRKFGRAFDILRLTKLTKRTVYIYSLFLMHCNWDFLLVNIIPMGISERIFLVPLQPIDISVGRTFIPTLTYDICSVYALSLSWKTPLKTKAKQG